MKRLSALLLVLSGAAQAECIEPERLGWIPTFQESFDSLDFRRWSTTFPWGARTIPDNREMQLYVDRDYAGLGLDPFRIEDGKLVIEARPVEGVTRAKLGHAYVSGLLTTDQSFRQTYGYFEMRAKLPAGKGLWPAFWLLPPDGVWPPEIDVMEMLGGEPGQLLVTVHTGDKGKGFNKTQAIAVPDTSAGFHDYGVLWERHKVSWYFDRCKVAEIPTPSDLHQPMYLLVNLAVGGWAGMPAKSTGFPARMVVDHIRAYGLDKP